MKVDGEASFSKAMRDAAKNTKSLDAELKLAEAQFKASGDAEKLMADRGKILNEQLGEQEKAVKAAKDMLQQLASAGYERNSTKVLEWRKKLAQAEQSVLEINGALNNNAKGLDEAGRKYEDLGASMQNIAQDANTAKAELSNVNGMASSLYGNLSTIGSEIGWAGLASGIKSINDAIDKAITRVAQLGSAIWDAGVQATQWADDLSTQSLVTGIDTQTLQQWEYAAAFIDTNVDTIVSSQRKLLGNMTSTNKETQLAFNELHVTTRNTDGSLRNLDDTFWDCIDALGEVEDPTKRDALAMKIFGKSAAELNPLIEAGRAEWQRYAGMAPIISDEKITALTSANDAFERMNFELNALKIDLLAQMAPIIELISDAIAEAAKELREFVNSEEGKQALQTLQDSISGLIKEFTEQDFGQIVKDAATNVASFIDSFAKLISDKDKIINALKGVGVAIATLKLAEAAVNAAKLLASLKLITNLNVPKSTTPAATPTTSSGKGIGATLSGIFGSTAAKVAGGTVAGIYTIAETMIKQIGNAREREKAASEVAEADDKVSKAAHEFGDTLEEAEAIIASNMHEWGVDAETARQMYIENGDNGPQIPAAAVVEVAEEANIPKAREVIELTKEQAEAAQKYWDIMRAGAGPDALALAYQDMFDAFADSDESLDKMDQVLEYLDTIPTELETLPTESEGSGENLVIGLANGINKNAAVAVTAAQNLANAVSGIIASTMMISSPSKLMEQYGAYIGEGLANGISDTQTLVAGATRSMLGGVALTAPVASSTPYGAGSNNSVPGLILAALSNMRVQIDGKQAGSIILPTIEELMSEEVGSRRYSG